MRGRPLDSDLPLVLRNTLLALVEDVMGIHTEKYG